MHSDETEPRLARMLLIAMHTSSTALVENIEISDQRHETGSIAGCANHDIGLDNASIQVPQSEILEGRNIGHD